MTHAPAQPIRVTLAGAVHAASPAAVLFFLEREGCSLPRAARLAAAETIAHTRDNGWWCEWKPVDAHPGAVRCFVYELDQHRASSPLRYEPTDVERRVDFAQAVLEAIDPIAALL